MTKNAAGLALALGLFVPFFGLSTSPISTAAPGDVITLDPATTHQIMSGWETTAAFGIVDFPNDYQNWAADAVDMGVNDLGLNRVRLEIHSEVENPVDTYKQYVVDGTIDRLGWKHGWYDIQNDDDDPNNIDPSGFQFTSIDTAIDNVVLPMKQAVEANGEQLYVNLNYVSFDKGFTTTYGFHRDNPDEYAEFMLAAFQHIESKYGFVPDAIEMILEPDNADWNGAQIGLAMVAAGSVLEANGYTPDFIAPSTASTANAVPMFNAMIAAAATSTDFLTEFSYHGYAGYSDSSLNEIASVAQSYGLGTSMLERIAFGHNQLHNDLKKTNVQAWQQYTLAYPNLPGILDDAQYLLVSNHTTASPTITYSGMARYLRQYFRYIRSGAVRIEASSNNINDFDPVAFINANGGYVVVVNASTGGSFSVEDLPAGDYGIQYTTGAEFKTDLADVTIAAGDVLDTSIPASGVLTVYAKNVNPTTISAVVNGSPSVGNTATVDIIADTLPNGLSGFEINISVASASTAEIIGVAYNPDLSLSIPPVVPASNVDLFAANVSQLIPVGATDVTLATLTVRGSLKGSTAIDITLGSTFSIQEANGTPISPIDILPGTLIISNSAPVVVASGNQTGNIGYPLSLPPVAFFDIDTSDTHTATIDWGDGTALDDVSADSLTVAGSHTYATSTVFTVTVSVTDSDGGTGSDTLLADVRDFPVLPTAVGPAQDLDGDGTAEDVNGSGDTDFNDVVLLFQCLLHPAVLNDPTDFDFNSNGRIDFDDVVQLFILFSSLP